MARIYSIEKVEPQRSIITQNGAMTTQRVVLRELDGNSQYDQRYSADWLSAKDLTPYIGKYCATHMTTRTNEKDGKSFSTLVIREIAIIG